MSDKKTRTHWQMPVVVLASMELVIFGAALHLAQGPDVSVDEAGITYGVGKSLPRMLLFLTTMSVAMASMGLYNVRQVLSSFGLLLRIVVAAAGGTLLLGLISHVIPDLYIGTDVLLTAGALV